MTTQIIKCKCKHDFQDKEYGSQMRLHNENMKYGTKCTVCGNIVKLDQNKK